MTPRNPIDYAGGFKAPVIGFYGGKDTGIPLNSVEKMRTALVLGLDPASARAAMSEALAQPVDVTAAAYLPAAIAAVS